MTYPNPTMPLAMRNSGNYKRQMRPVLIDFLIGCKGCKLTCRKLHCLAKGQCTSLHANCLNSIRALLKSIQLLTFLKHSYSETNKSYLCHNPNQRLFSFNKYIIIDILGSTEGHPNTPQGQFCKDCPSRQPL